MNEVWDTVLCDGKLSKDFHQGSEKSDDNLERLLNELKEKEVRNREICLETIVTVQMRVGKNLRQRLWESRVGIKPE